MLLVVTSTAFLPLGLLVSGVSRQPMHPLPKTDANPMRQAKGKWQAKKPEAGPSQAMDIAVLGGA